MNICVGRVYLVRDALLFDLNIWIAKRIETKLILWFGLFSSLNDENLGISTTESCLQSALHRMHSDVAEDYNQRGGSKVPRCYFTTEFGLAVTKLF